MGAGTPTYLDELKYSKKPFSKLIEIYTEISIQNENRKVFVSSISLFNYDWEYQETFKDNLYPYYDRRMEVATSIMKDTEVLVVTGYSFPIFNRETDSLLFKHLNPTKCKRIYIQDRVPDKILSRIKSFIPKEFIDTIFGDSKDKSFPFELITDLDQFYLPDEL